MNSSPAFLLAPALSRACSSIKVYCHILFPYNCSDPTRDVHNNAINL